MKKLLLLVFVLTSYSLSATLSPGATAEDWTLDDINGNTHSLYADYLDQGWSVVIDMSATWCGPCWTFHQSGTMDDIYDDYGPNGDQLIMPMLIEVDGSTNQACFFGATGCNNSTLGNWSTGKDYPMFNPPSAEASAINNDYNITVFPTMYVISPSGYVQPFTGSNTSYEDIESWGAYSFVMEKTTYTVDAAGCGDDSIDLHPEGGFGSISYEWSNGATTEDISGLAAGDYYVSMTDDNGYEWVIGPIEVTGFEAMSLDEVNIVDVDCYNNATGEISVSIDGGSGSFSYDWSNGDTGATISNLYSDDYELTVTDNVSGCEFFDDFSIYEPDELEVIYEVTNADCGSSQGYIEFDNDGGTYPFTYEIDGNIYFTDVINLDVGSYNALIIDANGCTENESFTIDQTVAPTAMASASGQLNCAVTTVTLDASGSTTGSSIEYKWTDMSGNVLGTASTLSVSNAGGYNLEVLDTETDCLSTSSVSVSSNTTAPAAMASTSNNLTCSTPTATLSAMGSSTGPNVSYLWTTVDGTISGANNTISITVTAAGTYNVEVLDNTNSCSASTSVTVTQSALPNIASTGNTNFCEGTSSQICVPVGANETIEWIENGVVVSTASCYTATSTTTYIVNLTNTASGCTVSQSISTTTNSLPNSEITGNAAFCAGGSTSICYSAAAGNSYEWLLNGNILTQSGSCVTMNQAGLLELVATSSAGCQSSSSLNLIQNSLPTASIATPSAIDCNNTSALLDLTTNSTDNIAWYDASGTLISTSEDISVSQAGTYSVSVTNANGCSTTSSVSVIADTAVPQASIAAPAELNCTNTSTELNLTVDNTNYNINWVDSNGNSVGTTEDITVTTAGQYTAIVSNAAGCEIEATVVVTADNSIPSIAVAAPNSLDCNASSVVLDATITNGSSITWTNENGMMIGSSEDITVTEAGTYTVTVMNSAGCITSDEVVVAQVDNAIAQSEFAYSNDDFNFQFTDASEGMVSTYIWNFGDGTTSNDANPSHTYTTPGYYNVCLETINECGSTTSCDEVLAVTALTSSIVSSDISCNGLADGMASVTVAGGLPGYTYEWSVPMATGNTATGLSAGQYAVLITDLTGAQTEVSFTINEPEPIVVDAIITNTVSSATDGAITLDISGGTGAYTIEWSDGGDGTNLAQGTYTATISDERGCQETLTYNVTGTSNTNDIPGLSSFTVSPNPSSNFANINVELETTIDLQVNLISLLGQTQQLSNTQTNTFNYKLDVTDLPAGIYFIQLIANDKSAVQRLMVTK